MAVGINSRERWQYAGRHQAGGLKRTSIHHCPTLRAPLSGIFLQTLPDLVTPLPLFISALPRLSTDTVSALRKVRVLIKLQALVGHPSLEEDAGKRCSDCGYQYDCRSNLAPKHARKHLSIETILVLFELA